jgi:UDP-N-acetylmuramyl tripeptide synthase
MRLNGRVRYRETMKAPNMGQIAEHYAVIIAATGGDLKSEESAAFFNQ